ncbi:uncharacterized protein LOC123428179 [Hordeum vulgare subsp. vulgare]|uniref:Uncharacterized protein n=1 Tax=Hordeum vulgare subsp. vulgare TaxID=112509 RepID=A0A8I6WZ13_HORVV|nr:uncharacterized protein LOC123428179 [Hordeum vulgare subsp. vulgare]KAI5010198.1 hypothetical protein ZWY2020_012335 [Hordeum vulgare]
MKARQFVNVVMRKYGAARSTSLYTVSRIKAEEQLFYRSTAEAQAAAAATSRRKKNFNMALPSSAVVPPWMDIMSRMPPGMLRFEGSSNLEFLPFYERSSGGSSKILCLDSSGRSFLYDIDAGSSHPVPSLNTPKGDTPICFSLPSPDALDPDRADALYVMNLFPVCRNPSNFEVLKYSDPSSCDKMEGWNWHRLPPPMAYVDASIIRCHTQLHIHGDPIFLVSSPATTDIGTHCFNTVSGKWFKAGHWTLPFFNRGEHVLELGNLWFGIYNYSPNYFCAMDLSSIRQDNPPSLLYKWQDLDLPEDWVLIDCSFVYLGAGRFCITKIFEFGEDEDTGHPTDMGAVISGVEVVPSDKTLQMVKHKSKFYNFVRDEIVRVF